VLDSSLKDPAFVAKMAKFLKASFKLGLCGETPARGGENRGCGRCFRCRHRRVQTRQMENVAKLITNANTPKIGYLDPAAYRRTIDVLLHSGGDTPVIKKDPGDSAMTHTVWDAAAKLK
jgi:NitT/TauT family transport system substrate-binding protein